MRFPVTVKLLVEIKEGWICETGPRPGEVTLVSESAEVQGFSRETVRARLQDHLADVTKHDAEIGWRVIAVNLA